MNVRGDELIGQLDAIVALQAIDVEPAHLVVLKLAKPVVIDQHFKHIACRIACCEAGPGLDDDLIIALSAESLVASTVA